MQAEGYPHVAAESDVSTEPIWLTRDRHEGLISAEVDVWVVQPEAVVFPDGDVLWIAPTSKVDRQRTHAATLTLEEAAQLAGSQARVPANPRRPIALARTVARG